MLPSFSPLEMARLLRLPFILTPHRSRSSHRYGTARGPDRKSESSAGAHAGVTETGECSAAPPSWTAPRAIQVILAPLVAAAPGLDGQTRPPGLDRPAIEVGADVGVSPNAAKAFANDQICPSRAALSVGLRAHARLARWFGTEVLGQYFFGNPGPSCVDGLLPPPPPQGPFTRRYDFFDERVTGYPFVLTTARVQILPYAGPAAAVRAFVGLGHIWIACEDRKSTRLNSSHRTISYAVFCLKKKINKDIKC